MTAPAPNKDEAVRDFYDRWADEYDQDYRDRPDTAPEDALLTNWLTYAIPRRASILDVGCGTGWFVDVMRWGRATYLGFDPSVGMLDHARAKHPGHRFLEGSAHDPWPSFRNAQRGLCERVAVALWVLNHCDRDKAMKRFRESDADRMIAIVRTGLDRAGTAIGHDDVPSEPWDLPTADAVGKLAHWKGFRYGGEDVSADLSGESAHYLWLEYLR